MGGGVLVIAFEFGNLCFNSPASEQSIIMVIASPSEFSSLDKFITAALTFLETDGELYGKRTVLYKERVNLPASNEDITFITEKINETVQEMGKDGYQIKTMSFWGTDKVVLIFKKGLKGSLLELPACRTEKHKIIEKSTCQRIFA